jgi:N-acetylglucosaminyldiphosphoundecaprenol N-acetyl-beta-D-mannosaminyltransferase
MKLDRALDLVRSCPLAGAIAEAESWIATDTQGVVCFANVHVIETARRSPELFDALSRAELVLPDGAPVAWALGHLCRRPSPRVAGTDFFLALCDRRVGRYRHFFLGATPETLERLENAVRSRLPGIAIAGAYSPPFRPTDNADIARMVDVVNVANPHVLWVGLGAPKQELFMTSVRGIIHAPVLAGVGAAFDFVAGTKRRAPAAMQSAGLEWAHRLACEPRRLVGRYLRTNTSFAVGILASLANSGGTFVPTTRAAPSMSGEAQATDLDAASARLVKEG